MNQHIGDSAQAAGLAAVFAAQRAAAGREPNPDERSRVARLAALERLLRENAEAIAAAIGADFGHRSADETRLIELFPALECLRHARRRVGRWMRRERRATSIWFLPGRSRVVYQPLGVVGIVVPWNYPVLLAVAPLAGALAAGNRAMVKMSEHAPATAALFARLVAERFAAEELTVIEGGVPVAQAFVALPFDHLLYTGSTAVGRNVMRAAAEHLTPVTLELGGKCPAIVGPGYPLAHAAERIVVGKTMNAGQTCIAPDYVLVPAGSESAFVEEAKRVAIACYPDPGRSPDYSSIVSARHFERLAALVEDARAKGAVVVDLAPGAVPDPGTRRLPPAALLGVNDAMRVMQEEIFGPLLPVVPYSSLDEAIAYVNARARPLALYLFDRDSANVERVLARTVSGGVTVNDTILHIAQEELPFGGVGPSGMGRYHGRDGFETFSVKKAVFYQSRLNGAGLFKPPYGERVRALLKLVLR
jgi:acyl-CoA reductase-like NAD-dependent aldehyde dehydrogenase